MRGPAGRDLVPLSSLVELEETIGPSAIHHFNRMRAATLSASTPPDVTLGDALAKLQTHLDETLPAGFSHTVPGQAQQFEESFYYLSITMVMAVVFIFLVLAAQFESLLYPFTILLTLPLATVGTFGSLWLLGLSFNVFGFIGMIMLLGLVTKNGILLVDYTLVLEARGHPSEEAARQAAGVRARPVLMTAISTMLGMMPIALGYGAGANREPRFFPVRCSGAAGMKQVQISVHSEYADLICEILEDQQADHYVVMPRAEGRNREGRHQGSQVFPGTLMLAFARVADDRVDALREKLAVFRDEKSAHRHLEALVLRIERQL